MPPQSASRTGRLIEQRQSGTRSGGGASCTEGLPGLSRALEAGGAPRVFGGGFADALRRVQPGYGEADFRAALRFPEEVAAVFGRAVQRIGG